MKCANCGNTNSDSLHDEGDAIYCSKCSHRTNKLTNKDDTVICPVCHFPRDRKAMYCKWCNDSSWGDYSTEAEKMNREYQKTITDDNLAFGKYKNYSSEKMDNYSDYDFQADYSINESTDSTAEDIGKGIGLIVAACLFLIGIGKGLYEKRKEKTQKKHLKNECQ